MSVRTGYILTTVSIFYRNDVIPLAVFIFSVCLVVAHSLFNTGHASTTIEDLPQRF